MVTLAIVVVWLLLIRRFRAALQVMIGSAAAAALICLPFFALAPTSMWNQLVRDQLFRGGRSGRPIIDRLDAMAGLTIVGRSYPAAITVAAVLALLCCAILAWSYREARLPALLMLGQGTFLLVTPTWFPHFAGFTAGPVALTAGAAFGRLLHCSELDLHNCGQPGPRRRNGGVREWLGHDHLQPPIPAPLPSRSRPPPRAVSPPMTRQPCREQIR